MVKNLAEKPILIELYERFSGLEQMVADMKEITQENQKDIKKMRSNLEKTYHTIYGNGQKGLVSIVENLEEKLISFENEKTKWHIGLKIISIFSAGICGLIGFCLNIIFR